MNPADFQAVFEASPNPYMLLDREFRFVAANAAYLRATGTTLATLVGRNLFDAFRTIPTILETKTRGSSATRSSGCSSRARRT